MRLTPFRYRVALAAAAVALLGSPALASAPASASSPGSGIGGHQGEARHVLLILVYGLHQQDLAWYVRTHPDSVLAGLMQHGLEYSRALTPVPSDSFPRVVRQVTGGDSRVTGGYYYDTLE